MPTGTAPTSAFLNIPYDEGFQRLYLAYIVGLTALGVRVACTLSLPNDGRLDRIIDLIESCDVSIHDLSRVGGLARFNMPIELGIALHHKKMTRGRHKVYVFERDRYRLQKTASDCNMLDPLIHRGTVRGVMKGLREIFYQEMDPMNVPLMLRVLGAVRRRLPILERNAGGGSAYDASMFRDIILAATEETKKVTST